MYAGVTLVYELDVVLSVVTEGTAQGVYGAWRQVAQMYYRGVYVPVWMACH